MLDKEVGRLMDQLDAWGIGDNTIVIFTSDNGPATINTQQIESWTFNMLGYSGRLRSEKHSQYEGGIRMPFIIRWPDGIEGGQIDSVSVVSALDLLPSFASMLEVDLEDRVLDGENRYGVLTGQPEERESILFWKTHGNNTRITALHNNWKMHKTPARNYELYDMHQDPLESTDIYYNHPEIAKELEKAIREWRAVLSDYRAGVVE